MMRISYAHVPEMPPSDCQRPDVCGMRMEYIQWISSQRGRSG